jgi:sensor histidine kinase YesM
MKMTVSSFWQSRWRKWGLGFGAWTLLGFWQAGQTYIAYSQSKLAVPWEQAFTWGLATAYILATPTPVVAWLGRRFPFERRVWPRHLMLHLLASVAYSFLISSSILPLDEVYGWVLGERFAFLRFFHMSFDYYLRVAFGQHLLVYWVILTVSLAINYYRKYQERERQATQLEAQLVQAQLQALKMQLHPHFLFNTLNAIWVLMSKDVESARQMLVRLSDLLRLTLESSSTQAVSLKQELDFLDRYLGIEQIRFHGRLQVKMNVEPDTLDAQVPNLILQPLVENAIKHGITPRVEPGRIEIHARRENHMLWVQIKDNGAGLNQEISLKEGVGLANTRARLRQMYGPHYSFDCINAPEGGFLVTVAIPFQTTPRHNDLDHSPGKESYV